MKRLTLAIDLDGVLHDHKNPLPGRRMGGPIDGARHAMILLARSHTLIVHTVRAKIDVGHVEDWLRFYGIPFEEVTAVKPNADCYLDDRGYRFTGWADALAWLNEVSTR